jgi:hypothetical protein
MTDDPSPKDEALARITKELMAERETRSEERFLWLLTSVILIDILLLGNMNNSATPIVVLVLELLGFVLLAKKMGIPATAAILDKIMSAVAKKTSSE